MYCICVCNHHNLYNRYFSLQASSPLHFGDTTRMDIENKICDEHGPRADSYDTAQKQAYDRMNEVSESSAIPHAAVATGSKASYIM